MGQPLTQKFVAAAVTAYLTNGGKVTIVPMGKRVLS